MDLIDTTNLSFDANSKKECMDELAKARWADGFVCQRCAGKKAYVIKSRNILECANKNCKKQTSPTSGTQFHGNREIEDLFLTLKNNNRKCKSYLEDNAGDNPPEVHLPTKDGESQTRAQHHEATSRAWRNRKSRRRRNGSPNRRTKPESLRFILSSSLSHSGLFFLSSLSHSGSLFPSSLSHSGSFFPPA
ncbi:MAG: transposase [Candidatus Obscuribacterales bacterium]|nr:transposase [Candidatus Obscuribacterales bacterium]